MIKKENIEKYVYIVVVALISALYNKLPFFSKFPAVLVSFFIGATFAVLAAFLYDFLKHKNAVLKYVFLSLSIAVLVSVSLFLNSFFSAPEIKETSIQDKIKGIVINSLPEISISDTLRMPELSEQERNKLYTCEVCGYKAILRGRRYCYNCHIEVFDTTRYNLAQKKEWLKERQLRYFGIDEATGEVNFFEPSEENGFIKDSTWKPVVTEKEVRVYDKELFGN